MIRSWPDAVAREVTTIEWTLIAIASPICAPSTLTGSVTSCPPLMAGVIIGPQHPGAVFATMYPPSRTVPRTSALGPMIPSQKRSTYTVSRAEDTAGGRAAVVAMGLLLLGSREPKLSASSPARRVRAVDRAWLAARSLARAG